MTSILIVEDHRYMAKVIARCLQGSENLQVAAVAGSAEEALELLPQIKVDLALVDVSLPHMSGIDLVTEIKQKYPRLPCLMLSAHDSKRFVERSIAAGAKGYIIKGDASAIIEGVQRVLAGETYINIDKKHS